MAITITRDLNVVSVGVLPVIHLSQYDSDFTLVFNLYASTGAFTMPTGTTAEIRGTKRDGNGYDAAASVSGSTVTVTGDEQMTAIAGQNMFEIATYYNNKRLNTINFILDVERAALDADTIISESVLRELNAIIEGAATATQAAEDAEDAADRAEEAARTLTIDPTFTQSGQAADAKAVGDALKSGIAPAYSASSTYSEGDYVLYDNKLYRATQDISTAEAWTAAHWALAPLAKDVADLKDDLEQNNSFDVLNYLPRSDSSAHGITFAWDGDTCTVSGTSDAIAFNEIFKSTNQLPYGIVPGNTYIVKFANTQHVHLRIYDFSGGASTELLNTMNAEDRVTIPSSCSGLIIRLWVAKDEIVSPSESVTPMILSTVPLKDTNKSVEFINKNISTVGSLGASKANQYFEPDGTNGVYVKLDGAIFLRGQVGKNIAWSDLTIEKATSPKGVANCILIPLNDSFVYDMEDETCKLITTNGYLDRRYIELFTVSRHNLVADIVSGKLLYLYQSWMADTDLSLPYYWDTYITNKIPTIQSKDTVIGNHGDSFIFITDVHWDGNTKHSPKLINRVLENTDVTKVYSGGDIINEESTGLLALGQMRDFIYRFKGVDFTTITGNHDWNDNGKTDSNPTKYLSNDDVYSVMFKFNEKEIDTKGNRYFYKDNPSQKIRYIFVDTGHTRFLLGNDTEQQTWIANTLQGTETGWGVIIVTHMYWGSLDDNNTPVMMSAGNTLNSIIDSVINNMDAEIIALVIGHTHYDYAVQSEHGFWKIATGTDDYARSNTAISPTMTPGTTTEQLFDVYHIDTSARKIYLTRIGAGLDREFSY